MQARLNQITAIDWRSGRAQLRPQISNINLFSYGQGIVDLDAEIPDRAFDFGMPEQELDGPQIAGASIDQGSFRASKRMSPKKPRVQPDAPDPLRYEARILSS